MTNFQETIDRYRHLDGMDLLRVMIKETFKGRIAAMSSFGTEAAVLLHMVSEIAPETPVVFLETGQLFPETLDYQKMLQERLIFANLRIIRPNPDDIAAADPDGSLWKTDPDACCHIRKVKPLEDALSGFDAWITGRKRHHGDARVSLETLEWDGAHIKVNPLARWTRERIMETYDALGLPRHPLEAHGYPSVGCAPCTGRVEKDDDLRAGRWNGTEKTECGIHKSPAFSKQAPSKEPEKLGTQA
jgi:phosphoadenosine phosphosulfate reductase